MLQTRPITWVTRGAGSWRGVPHAGGHLSISVTACRYASSCHRYRDAPCLLTPAHPYMSVSSRCRSLSDHLRVCSMPIRVTQRRPTRPTSCLAVTSKQSATAEQTINEDNIAIEGIAKESPLQSADHRQHPLWQKIAKALASAASVGILAILLVRQPLCVKAAHPSLPPLAFL